MEIGQIIKYRDVVKNKIITGKIICIIQILDSVNKNDINTKHCFIQEREQSIPLLISEKDIIYKVGEEA